MKSNYSFLCKNDRPGQILILEENNKSIASYIPEAYESFLGKNGKIEERDNVEEIVGEILTLATKLAEKGTNEPFYDYFNFSEGAIASSEKVKIIRPRVEELRQELFSKKTSEFKKSPKKALEWLKEQSLEGSRSNRERLSKNEKRIKELKKEIDPKIVELDELTGDHHSLTRSGKEIIPFPPVLGQIWRNEIPVFNNHCLSRLEEKTRECAEITGLSQAYLVRYVLTGIKPLFPVYSIKKKYPDNAITLEIYRPLNKKVITTLYHQIKAIYGKKGRQFLSQKHQLLYSFVEDHGGSPRRKKGKFWDKISKEWNSSHPEDKYENGDCVRITYGNILKRVVKSDIAWPDSYEKDEESQKGKLSFKTKEELEQYKTDMREVSRMHGRWLKAIKEGKLKTRPVGEKELLQIEARLKRKQQDNKI